MDIDQGLVRRLIEAQFPQWAELAVTPVASGGWDNRSFRLGGQMVVRMPCAEIYSAQVEKEQCWLPMFARILPIQIPLPLAMGQPGEGYPWRWSIYAWLEGETANIAQINDPTQFAVALAGFLGSLQEIDTANGPLPGSHNFYRGDRLTRYDAETRHAIAMLDDRINVEAVTGAWEESLAAPWRGPPLWLHGDFSPENLLVRGGILSAVIDFGCCAVGDPACDLAIAWTFRDEKMRAAFRAALAVNQNAWLRGRGWALWKALIVLAGLPGNNPSGLARSRLVLEEVLASYGRDT